MSEWPLWRWRTYTSTELDARAHYQQREKSARALKAMEARKKAHPNRSDEELLIIRNKGPGEIQGMMVWEAMEHIKTKHGEAKFKTMKKRGCFSGVLCHLAPVVPIPPKMPAPSEGKVKICTLGVCKGKTWDEAKEFIIQKHDQAFWESWVKRMPWEFQ
jgi:hypothetical protein